jgi:hypothetical protein
MTAGGRQATATRHGWLDDAGSLLKAWAVLESGRCRHRLVGGSGMWVLTFGHGESQESAELALHRLLDFGFLSEAVRGAVRARGWYLSSQWSPERGLHFARVARSSAQRERRLMAMHEHEGIACLDAYLQALREAGPGAGPRHEA